jgi:PDZ domain/Peptidase family M28
MVGTGTTVGIDSLIDGLGKSSGLTIKKVAGLSDGFGGSDHQSFYAKNVPVLFAFTGVHRDYHRPTDDANLINYPGMARIADYLELIVLEIIRRPERPTFARLTRARPGPGGRDPARIGSSAYLGTMPDYASDSKDGLRLAGVSPGGPAEKGGLKEGDVITRFGGKAVGTIYDFMESLGQHKPGEKVELVIKRDGKDLKVQVTLGSRPRE